MVQFVAKRVATVIVSLLVLTMVAFALAEVIPGDPALSYAGPGADAAALAAATIHLGLNRPLVVQYWVYLERLVQGNFGISIFTHRPVAQDLASALPPSLELVAAAMLLDILVAIPLGVISAARAGGTVDGMARLGAMAGSGIPPFFLAVMLQYLIAYRLGWLPQSGEFGSNVALGHTITGFPLVDLPLQGRWGAWFNGLEHLILPAIALAAGFAGVIMRTVRSSVLGTLGEDYIVLAYAKGLKERRVLLRHALRNALLPSITIMGMQVGWMLGSTILVESIFGYPGIGTYTVNALFQSDLWAIVGVVLVIGATFVLSNFVTDIVQMGLDPSVRARRLGRAA